MSIAAAEDLRENAGQWAAYESTGNCVILAGPGSGKTKTITIKIARLLQEIARPQRLACITYSNACVGELRTRLKSLGVEEDSGLLVSTVHSFCLTELIMPYGKLAGFELPEPLEIASPSECADAFNRACTSLFGRSQSRSFRTSCDRVRRTLLDRESDGWIHANTRVTGAIVEFEAELARRNLMDFDGLILNGLRLIETCPWVRKAIKAKFPIIVIDEYQDLGLPLHRMVVRLMREAGVRIIAVGDPDQSIYGFTGAQPALLRALAASRDVEPINLRLNYRCANQIITASKTLLPTPPDFESHDAREGEIQIYRLERSPEQQAAYALTTVLPALLRNNPSWKPGDIAFLYRTQNDGAVIANAADAAGVRYFRSDGGALIKRSRIIDWLTDVARWCVGGWETGEPSLGQILRTWRLMRRSLGRGEALLKAQSRLIAFLFGNRDGERGLHDWLSELLRLELHEMFDNETGVGDEEERFMELLGSCEDGEPLGEYTIEIFSNHGKSPNLLNLITLHSSKGLEFEAVIMIGLEQGVFPGQFDRDEDDLAEAKRLFYVGVTRAKNQIHLMYSRSESPFIARIREATEGE